MTKALADDLLAFDAHSETVGAGGQMRVRDRMQVFATRRESNRVWLLHAWSGDVDVVAALLNHG